MNKTNLRESVQKLNKKCGDCGGYGVTGGGYSKDNHKNITVHDEVNCPTCSGRGYTVALEEGCEVGNAKYIKSDFDEGFEVITLMNDEGDIFETTKEYLKENLGKKTTLQDLLRALAIKFEEDKEYEYLIRFSEIFITIVKQYKNQYDLEFEEVLRMEIDESPEQQTPERQEKLIEILTK